MQRVAWAPAVAALLALASCRDGRDHAALPENRGETAAERCPDAWLAQLAHERAGRSATLLGDGKSVLIAGGIGSDDQALATVELWRDGHLSPLGKLAVARSGHTATLLRDGRVLIAGGDEQDTPMDAVEIYHPSTGRSAPAHAMLRAHARHSATRLADGRVLVAGGREDPMQLGGSKCEIFDPAAGTWTAAHDVGGRESHAAVLLRDGRVLVVGGLGESCYAKGCEHDVITSLEVWDPARDRWSPAGTLATRMNAPSAVLLADGRVGIADGAPATLCSAPTQTWPPTR